METMKNILGNRGLTSSEANHVTNIVKELVKGISVDLKTSTSYIKEGNDKLYLDENKKDTNWVEKTLDKGKIFGLSAWLKTGIKYKETLLNDIDRKSFVSNLAKPELEDLPVTPKTDFDTYLHQLNTKELSEYLYNESLASHIGKLVHNFDSVRVELDNFIPTSFIRTSEGTVTVRSEKLYSTEELMEGFFTLQKEHREAEKVVNLYKSRYHDWVKDVLETNNSERKSAQSRNFELQVKYNKDLESERLDFEAEKREEKKTISALRIIIPNELQPILDEVNEYAKK